MAAGAFYKEMALVLVGLFYGQCETSRRFVVYVWIVNVLSGSPMLTMLIIPRKPPPAILILIGQLKSTQISKTNIHKCRILKLFNVKKRISGIFNIVS